MKICFLPAGDAGTASSRIRVYSIVEALRAAGVVASTQFDPAADYFIFQKKVDAGLLALARSVAAAGKPVIYDIDDLPPAQDYWAPPPLLEQMLKLATLVTTDTQGHVDLLRRDFVVPAPIALIPDCIDYFPTSWQAPAAPAGPTLRVLWFGSLGNIAMFERYVDAMRMLPQVQLVVATGAAGIPALMARYPHIEFQPWTLEGFPAILRSCQLTLLMHDGSEVDRTKSNNKMICSINMGVPAVVSDTPEYAATARLCGVDDAVFRSVDEVAQCVARLASVEQRQQYLAQAQPVIWQRFSAPAVAQRLLALLQAQPPVRPAVVDFSQFHIKRYRSGPLNFGWVGDVPARQDEVLPLLIPAMGGSHPMTLLHEGASAAEQAAFYQTIDVLLLTGERHSELVRPAMACGVFPVAISGGGLALLIASGQNGLVVEPHGAALHQALAWCCAHSDEVRAMGYRQAQALAVQAGQPDAA